MPIPPLNPPTDNLYKFMAFCGLILFVAGLVYPQMRNDYLAQIEKQFWQSSRECEQAFQKYDNVDAEMRRKFQTRPSVESKDYFATLDELADVMRKHLEDGRQAFEAREQHRRWQILCYSGAGVGFLVGGLGFLLWHRRWQRPQDELLQRQLQQK
jgi:hypothetical protein